MVLSKVAGQAALNLITRVRHARRRACHFRHLRMYKLGLSAEFIKNLIMREDEDSVYGKEKTGLLLGA